MTLPAPRFAFVEGALDRADALRDKPDALHAYWPCLLYTSRCV